MNIGSTSKMRFMCVLVLTYFLHTYTTAQLVYPYLRVETDSAVSFKNLQIVPVRFVQNPVNLFMQGKKVLSMQQALQSKKLEIKEFFYNGDANVKLLQVTNKSNDFILIQSGDMIFGGKQDRMMAESKLLPPKTKDEFIDVYCIERGRWSSRVHPFNYIGNADDILRKIMDSTGSQQLIWKEIEKRLPHADPLTTTWPYLQSYVDTSIEGNEYFTFFQQYLAKSDSSFAGFIGITNNSIIGCELFATTSLTNAAYSSFIKGWIRTATLHPFEKQLTSIPKQKLYQFTHQLLSSEEMQKHFLRTHGKAFYYKNIVFHITAHG